MQYCGDEDEVDEAGEMDDVYCRHLSQHVWVAVVVYSCVTAAEGWRHFGGRDGETSGWTSS